LAAFLVLSPEAVGAQQAEAPAFGLASVANHTLMAFDFTPLIPVDGGTAVVFPGSPNRYFTEPFAAPLRLPNGVVIESLEIEGCDNFNGGQISGSLSRAGLAAGNTVVVEFFTTGSTATPGCGNFTVPVSPIHVVDNAANKYWVEVATLPGNGSVSFAALRVRYRLQVSPAPAAATFPNDVPTSHPYFRFVEALAAAGITGGIGPGSYGPDLPITRGQMAVFLAAALGLHFPG
jgi:hypothetical protein